MTPIEKKNRLEVAAVIVKARNTAGLTQMAVAKRMKVDPSTVARLERGRMNLTLDTLVAFAQAIGKKLKIEFV